MRNVGNARGLHGILRLSLAAICALVFTAGLLGCQKPDEPVEPAPTPAATQPAGGGETTPTPTPEASAPAEPAATIDAVALVKDQCTKCHGIPRIADHRGEFDPGKWDETVTRMMGKSGGAELTAEEKDAVVKYLASDEPLPEA